MKGNNTLLLHLFYTLLLFLGVSAGNGNNDDTNRKEVYIVYMGAADSTNVSLRNDHAQVLNLVLRRNENALVRNYKHGFSGFAARLSKEEAASIAHKPGVVSVFPDPILNLHTTRSWEFLKYQTHVKIDTKPNAVSNSSSSSDIILGVLDTGIWPEAASFSDEGMGPVPSRWKGTCMKSQDFNSSNCNRKLIGARFYTDPTGNDDDEGDNTPRDSVGHGTHVASTAVGATVTNASYYGLAAGSATGGSSESRLAVYRVCSNFGCRGSAILGAFDDAISDGVDVLSLSLGASPGFQPDLTTDPIALGAFHAVERGILVVCSAGNSGPSSSTVVNDAPWILTVAASTIDRDFQSDVVLGVDKTVKGRAINFSPLSNSAEYPMIYGESAKAASTSLAEARQCHPDSLDANKVKGKIVVCDGKNDGYSTSEKIGTVKEAGGIGLVHITDQNGAIASYYGDFPATVISSKDGVTILQYINSTSNPVATILPTATVLDYKPAPVVPNFSSRGPSSLSSNILKPDIAAPGVNILAAWIGNNADDVPKGRKPSLYNIISGTSMACPHVSGLASSVKTRNPTWSASAIKSAIMTSAIQINNLKAPITTDSGRVATPYDYGAGEMTTSESLQPGLVYETNTIDYLNYLCYIGLNITTVKVISRTVPANFSCPKDSSSDLISNINYPSIAVNFTGKAAVNVSRTVTNVGEEDETAYSPVVEAPSGVKVTVTPDKLQFTKSSKKLGYQVIFSSTLTSLKEDLFGSITWSNGKYMSCYGDHKQQLVSRFAQEELLLCLLPGHRQGLVGNDDTNRKEVYIVYMGAADSTNAAYFRNDHAQVINSVLLARLSKEEATSIAHKPGVVSVFPDPVLKLHTTRSWDFLKYQTHVKIDTKPNTVSKSSSVIGILDTAILAALDDAIEDGVDVLSVSLGASTGFRPDLTSDPIAIGAFHAVERGILVVCFVGNDGPSSYTLVNDAPWILTVAASTIDRDFQSNVVLGVNKIIKGRAINLSPFQILRSIQQCHPNSLDVNKVKGKIVVCEGKNDKYSTRKKVITVKAVGGIGLVHITDQNGAIASNYGDFPATVISSKDGITILQYINSTSNPVATILPTTTVLDSKPAPLVPNFSSRGPSSLSSNILKPDIAAPGVNILAAWIENGTYRRGLVYETSTIDYLNFLCYIGFNVTAVKVISKTVPHNFNCPKDLSSDHVSNINYPSIAINFSGKRAVNVSRTVTNVGEEDETDLSSSFLLSWQIHTKRLIYPISFVNKGAASPYMPLIIVVIAINENAIVRNYKHGFSGFAARLSKEEANSISQKPGVVSVFPDPILKLHTTRSWDFLKSQTRVNIDTKPNTESSSSSSSDVILGILDTGIWPEAASFSDEGFGPVPSRWKGTCMTSKDFNSSNCNRKLIGARFYPDPDGKNDDNDKTPRDSNGHGTHVASTAVCVAVSNASFYGLATGTAKGGSPESRLAVYKVCYRNGCRGSAILAAFDDAIADGVDVLSLSLGVLPLSRPKLTSDTIAIGAFHAVQRGILVVCAAGNAGPLKYSVVNDAPWILTVAASTIDRDLQSNVVLGTNHVVKGRAINFSPLSNSPEYPMVYGESAKAKRANLGTASNPVGTILATVTVPDYKPAPVVGFFSSRGPSTLSSNILKPDIAAPGVNILAAWIGDDTSEVPKGRKPSLYNIISGTSMATPHVSGLVCSVKTQNPSWSASAIKSAIMTSAIQNDNLKAPITTDSGSIATPYDYGAGEITTSKPLQPGLVYETNTVDYLNYLCYTGHNLTTVKVISGTVPDNFNCPKDSTSDLISNINYPSIAVNFTGKANVVVSRTVTNVAEEDETVYSAVVEAPKGVFVKVTPNKLQFTKSSKKLSYQVIFAPKASLRKDLFGSITWSNGKYIVRSPFVLTK
ncbi:CO(2)-response secreted protease isoform C [Glycine soja]|uniref:CO(2)-response secreted protease isoform C n=1 Tax=Glycine soja TaxID=3848 RepID=A0A445KUT2_GLYSO|nr:CO(2)-response secreted protease isoform C [Glycine soja]